MARKDLLKSLLTPEGGAPPAADPVPAGEAGQGERTRYAGAVGAVGQSIAALKSISARCDKSTAPRSAIMALRQSLSRCAATLGKV